MVVLALVAGGILLLALGPVALAQAAACAAPVASCRCWCAGNWSSARRTCLSETRPALRS